MLGIFTKYITELQSTPLDEKTEHTDRSSLQALIAKLIEKNDIKATIIHEPKRSKKGLGAPDFKIKSTESIVGYIENKGIGENLNKILKSDQITKYRKLCDNLLLTDYLEWVWIKDEAISRATLCYATDIEYARFKLETDKVQSVANLICNFLSIPPKGIKSAKKLAVALAIRSSHLREYLHEELTRQHVEDDKGKLHGLYSSLKESISSQLTIKEFADTFSQMLSYGLFLAKLGAENELISLNNPQKYIPKSFQLIRELVEFLDVLEEREQYREVKWIVEEILGLMNNLDLQSLRESLSFTKPQLELFKQTEEERLLYRKDPYIYFYEDFLANYDAKMRKSKGIYYTPMPIVNFIIKSIQHKLENTFNIKKGFADKNKVTVLDFATGTGTFLLEIIHHILEVTSKAKRDLVIKEHVLTNLFGFEYLIAPYTIAHLKISQYLEGKDYTLSDKERLQIYLTNTLEPIEAQQNWLLPALSHEGVAAQKIKNMPILVITGNPPYRGHSKNTGVWIKGQIEKYKEGFPDLNKPGQGKWLQDDYVKFIRFAQWEMEKVDEGIVGIITNHAFIDNPTFKGMRHSLLQTFSEIYILDLHGNRKRKEIAPGGEEDQNVFDIEQGVAISIFVRKKRLRKKVFHADLWGKRREKYIECIEKNIDDIDWQEIQPKQPLFFFKPWNYELHDKYTSMWSIPQIFSKNGDPAPGIVTTQDQFAISFTKDEAIDKIDKFLKTTTEKDARKTFRLCSQAQWDYTNAKEELSSGAWKEKLENILYQPFDIRWTVFDNNVAVHRRERVMNHMLRGKNIGLCLARRKETSGDWTQVFCTDKIMQHHTLSMKEVNFLFPLYLYAEQKLEKGVHKQAKLHDAFKGKDKIENLDDKFRKYIDNKYNHHYEPEDVIGYIYAVLFSNKYRKKYSDFLRIDFPHIPFVDKRSVFDVMSSLGKELLEAHLMNKSPGLSLGELSVKGDNEVAEIEYVGRNKRLYINSKQYFSPLPKQVWEFDIGGYQVIHKYLKNRKGRQLSLDEIENIENTINTIALTIGLTKQIDDSWDP